MGLRLLNAGTLQAACLKPRKFEDLYQAVQDDYVKKQNRSLDRLHNAFSALKTMFAGWLASAMTEERLNEYFTTRLA